MTNSQKKIKLIVINTSPSTESIEWLFKTIKGIYVQNLDWENFRSNLDKVSKNEILVFNLDLIDSNFLDHLKKLLEIINPSNVFFVINNRKSSSVFNLPRMGFLNIYLFPEEEFELRNSIIESIEKIKLDEEAKSNKEKVQNKYDFNRLIGNSPKFLECIEIAKQVSRKSDATVLLLGETGTGKELLAKAIHYNSERANCPFIEINTSAISETLFEAELFGYEKGAFTDAKTSKPGLLEIAEDGTAFLDEIGDLNLNLQVKLLRAIENKTIKRVGGIKDIKINCRIIAATNQNLERLIEEKKFRGDLYYRLKVITINLPPLRERTEDIIPLSHYFVEIFNKKYNTNVEGLTQKAKQILLQYSWPGNIRELSNVIERAVLLTKSKYISEQEIQIGSGKELSKLSKNFIEIRIELEKANIQNLTYELAVHVLKLVDGNKSQAARILGISRPSLQKILNSKNIEHNL